jgi:hypothetical protein
MLIFLSLPALALRLGGESGKTGDKVSGPPPRD